MKHVLTMANLKLKPSLFTPRPNVQDRLKNGPFLCENGKYRPGIHPTIEI